MSAAVMDSPSGVSVSEVLGKEGLFMWSATLGDGTRRGYASSHGEALERGQRAKRYLAAIESHDPDVLEAQAQTSSQSGRVELVSSWGGIIEVNEADVEQALAAGCTLPGDDEMDPVDVDSRPERARRAATTRAAGKSK